MPTSTFMNLSAEKREKILRAAVAEFSRKNYGEASINRIIQAAEIPRGSFYQYFADKQDLFHYVLRHYGEGLERVVLESLDAVGGSLPDLPLVLFDRIVASSRDGGEQVRDILEIMRQNAGMDIRNFWDFTAVMQLLLTRMDLSQLSIANEEEAMALIDLLIAAVGQAFMAVCCGKLTPEESRRRLSNKIALLRRGVEKQEDSQC